MSDLDDLEKMIMEGALERWYITQRNEQEGKLYVETLVENPGWEGDHLIIEVSSEGATITALPTDLPAEDHQIHLEGLIGYLHQLPRPIHSFCSGKVGKPDISELYGIEEMIMENAHRRWFIAQHVEGDRGFYLETAVANPGWEDRTLEIFVSLEGVTVKTPDGDEGEEYRMSLPALIEYLQQLPRPFSSFDSIGPTGLI